jgi:hypothetical protein
MANRSPSNDANADSLTRDEVLKRMLKMPPKPHNRPARDATRTPKKKTRKKAATRNG